MSHITFGIEYRLFTIISSVLGQSNRTLLLAKSIHFQTFKIVANCNEGTTHFRAISTNVFLVA